MSDPADGTPDGEQYSKHVGGKSKCPQDNSGIEVHIGIEFLFDKVIILQGNSLQFHCQFQGRILHAEFVEYLMACYPHHLGSGVMVLVDPMAKSHQAEIVLGILCFTEIF